MAKSDTECLPVLSAETFIIKEEEENLLRDVAIRHGERHFHVPGSFDENRAFSTL
jgi:hypothetical protein